MPVSLCEWRVRIGRFMKWQTREFDFDVYLHELFERRRQRLQLLIDLIHNTVKSAECSQGSRDSCSSDSFMACKSTLSPESCQANKGDIASFTAHGSVDNFSDIGSHSQSDETSRNCSKRESTNSVTVAMLGSASTVACGDTHAFSINDSSEMRANAPCCPGGSGTTKYSVDVSPSACSGNRTKSDISSTPNTTELLLHKAGDVERNPGPGNSDNSTSPRDFDDILKSVARNIRGNIDIDNLGKALGFEVAVIERYIDTNHAGAHITYNGTLQMLRDWYGKQTKSNARQALKDAMVTAGLIQLADEFLSSNEAGSQSETPISPELLQQCIDELKEFYNIELCQIQTDPMNFDVLLEFEKIFTNLLLLGENKTTRGEKPLEYEDLLKTKINGVLPKRLLVQGEGGAGKSTLCAKIAWDWANGKGFHQFKMIMVVPLRKAKGKTVGEIVKSYLSDSNPVQPKQIDEYILSHPKDVFLVFDGLDEFDGQFGSDEDLMKILMNDRFKSSTVLVTSRPWIADQIRHFKNLKKVYAFIAVKGFTRENIDTYVERFFAQDTDSVKDGEDLITFMEDNRIIAENMAPFPIYTAMLCVMWREYDGERRKAMSKLHTFSQLFKEMINFLVDHYLSKSVEIDDDVNMSDHRSAVNDCLLEIGKIAFNGLLEKRLLFTEDELISYRKEWETCCHVGVLTMEKNIASRRHRNDRRSSKSILFPHKLFQEYMSGMYLASLYTSNHAEYEKLLNDRVLPNDSEYTNLLYFLSALEKGAGVDIISHLSYIEKAVDMAFECHDQVAIDAINANFPTVSTYLTIDVEQLDHTVSGYLFVVDSGKMETIEIARHCGFTHSWELADLICTSPSLRVTRIGSFFNISLEDCFFSLLAAKAGNSKVETLKMIRINLRKRASESHDLAKAICNMPHLLTLSLGKVHFHDDFYSMLSSMASSAKVNMIVLNMVKLSPDRFQTFISLPKLQDLRVDRLSLPDDHSKGGCEEGKNEASRSPVSRLTIDSQTLSTWSHGDMPSTLPYVHEVTVMIYDTLDCDYPKEATLPGAKEIVLEKHEYGHDSINKDVPSLKRFIRHCFPNAVSVTLRNLNVGNLAAELIIESLTKETLLESLRFTRCKTDSGMDSLVQTFNEKHDVKITVEHGVPEKTKGDEMDSFLEDSDDGDSDEDSDDEE